MNILKMLGIDTTIITGKQFQLWKLCFDPEFSEDEIAEIKKVFPNAYSKKKYSIEGTVCQWFDDKLYVETRDVELVIKRFEIHIGYYRTEYSLVHRGSFKSPISIPHKVGVYHCDKKWYTIRDLIDIKDSVRL